MTEQIPHYNAHSAAYPPPVDTKDPHIPWSYRVSKQTMRNSDEIFAIREFYGANCKSWSQNEIAPSGDSVEDLRWVLTNMLESLDKPVIDIGEYDNGIGQPI